MRSLPHRLLHVGAAGGILGPDRMDLPIAFCDARTVTLDDARTFVVRDDAGAGGLDFEALAILAPVDGDRHRWHAYPKFTQLLVELPSASRTSSIATAPTTHSAGSTPTQALKLLAGDNLPGFHN